MIFNVKIIMILDNGSSLMSIIAGKEISNLSFSKCEKLTSQVREIIAVQ